MAVGIYEQAAVKSIAEDFSGMKALDPRPDRPHNRLRKGA
jgi:hypothetical protein